ncbi:MAG: extracellular solute-binding protein [Anaerolineaceae bacterium]|jgi:raffinose/stachyose/melibiose transport system substrate-binding protein|nr:extracellular solute-binding protein [Anaerolineae bacterium]MDP3448996.1 extracellular solute-binding protein [Anaerolineaceae bacterium]
MTKKLSLLLSVVIISALLLAACGTPAATEAPVATDAPAAATEAPAATEAAAEPVTITWWHITTKDPGLTEFQKMADDYMAMHPNVTIELTILENEAFKTKLTTVMQSGEVPDIFQSWGQGGMIEQVNAGLLKDITADLEGEWGDSLGALDAFAVDGKSYGVPWDMGAVTFWYNKDLFAQAGVEVPTTWSEFLTVCETLKAAGITPISVGAGDKWPGMHIWAYLVSRIGGAEAFSAAAASGDARTGSFEDEAFVQAGYELKKLVDGGYFQEGFLGATHDDMNATFGNGKAAMELGGQWSPSVQAANSADTLGVKNLGMFNFPAVEGGVGLMTDIVGGGNGFAIGKDAPAEAIDFVKYLTNLENQKIVASTGMGIPVAKGASESIADPNMVMVADAVANSTYYQLYFDQVLPSAMGSIINDAVQKIFAGTATPEEVAAEIEAGFLAQ